MFSILWTIIIGFVAGVIAKFITPGDKEPQGFILTTVLGIIGAFDLYRTGRRLVSGSEGRFYRCHRGRSDHLVDMGIPRPPTPRVSR
jgi:uncharacterized membrane protein YeaQ/YmgE (transglycosylase-associated protein family)